MSPLTGEAKKKYQRELMQKRRSNKEGLTGSNEAVGSNAGLTDELAETISVMIEHLEEIDARLDRLEAAQAKVSVVPGSAIRKPKEALGHSKEAQAKGRMTDNSWLGRVYREQNGE